MRDRPGPGPNGRSLAAGRAAGLALILLLSTGVTVSGWGAERDATLGRWEFPVESPQVRRRLSAPGRVFIVDGLQAIVVDTAWASTFAGASDLPWAVQGFERLQRTGWRLDSGALRLAGLFGNEIGDAHLQEIEQASGTSNRMPVLGGEAIVRKALGVGEGQMRVVFDQNDEFSARTEPLRVGRSASAKRGELSWFGENTPFRSALGGGALLARGDWDLRADARSGWWWTTSPASGDLVPWRGTEGAASLGAGSYRIRAAWMEWRTAGADRRGRWAVGDGEVEAWGRGGGLEWRASLAARSRELSWPGRFEGARAITFPAALAVAARGGDHAPRRQTGGDAEDRGGEPDDSGAVDASPSRCPVLCLETEIEATREGDFVAVRPRVAGEAALGAGSLLWSATAFLRRGLRVPEAWELLSPGQGGVAPRAEMSPDESRLGGDLAMGYRLDAGALALECGSGLAWEDGAPFFAPDSFLVAAQGGGLRAGHWERARAYLAPRGRIEARYAPLPVAGIFAAASVRDAWGSGAGQLEHRPARTLATLGLRGRLPSDLAYEAAVSRVGEKLVRGWLPDGAAFRVPAHVEGRIGLAQSALDGRLHLSLSGLNAFGREILEHPRGNAIRFRILAAARYQI